MLPAYDIQKYFSLLFLKAYVELIHEFLRTSVEICWCSDWFNQSLGFWFSFNHMILYSTKWWVSFLNLIILGPVSSTETDKRDPSQQYVEGNYNGGADDLTANTCTVCRLLYISVQVRKWFLKGSKQQNDFYLCYYLWFAVKRGWVNGVRQFSSKNEQHSSY